MAKAANKAGLVVALLACGLFAFNAHEMIEDSRIRLDDLPHIPVVLSALSLYLAAYLALILSWNLICSGVSGEKAIKANTKVLLVSQIGKYLPGNIGHLIGRIYLAKRYGLKYSDINISILTEISATLVAGSLISLSSIWLFSKDILGSSSLIYLISISITALVLVILAMKWKAASRAIPWRPLAYSLALLCLVFCLVGGSNVILLANGDISGMSGVQISQVVVAVTIGWVLGFITPGAPAGIGIREVTTLGLLSNQFPADQVLIAVALFRAITLAGDAIAWLLGMAIELPCSIPNSLSAEHTLRSTHPNDSVT